MVSAVTGDNLSLLHHFLSRLQPALSKEARSQALQGLTHLVELVFLHFSLFLVVLMM